jgi:hypothetical protein
MGMRRRDTRDEAMAPVAPLASPSCGLLIPPSPRRGPVICGGGNREAGTSVSLTWSLPRVLASTLQGLTGRCMPGLPSPGRSALVDLRPASKSGIPRAP